MPFSILTETMERSHNLRPRSAIDWKQLCFGDALPRMKKEKVVTRDLLPETYTIERLISKKNVADEVNIFFLNEGQLN